MNRKEKLIAEIHAEFDTAQDRLLNQANEILNGLSNDRHQLTDTRERLMKLGFNNVPIVKDSLESYSKAELINYYKNAYPFLKFLTEFELKRICNKYGLIFKPVDNFIGDVPLKNIKDIESAQKLDINDTPQNLEYCELKRDNTFFLFPTGSWLSIWNRDFYRVPKRIEGEHFRSQYTASDYIRENYNINATYIVDRVDNYTENRQGLFICAPKSQFSGENKSISFKTIEDPIVFRYVRGGIQVLTKWGLEANDPDLVVPKLN